MFRFFLIFISAWLIAVSATAQEHSTDVATPSERLHYFIVDASGSMSTKVSTAQERTREIIGEILTDEASVWVSRSFVGGTNGGTCNSPVTISTPVQITSVDEVNEIKVTADGGTQLGAAFEAAIQSLGDAPATIYMFTDGNESQQCGRSLCDAYRYINPDREKVELRPISTVEGLDLDDQFACIYSNDEHDSSSFKPPPEDHDKIIKISYSENSPTRNWNDLPNYSKIYPIYLFSTVAFFIFIIVLKYSSAAKIIENDIDTIKLNNNVKATNDAATNPHEEVSIMFSLCIFLALFAISVMLIIYPPCPFFENSQKAVWMAFDSDFATAFSILATAPILFSGSQYIRYQRAIQNKSVISGAYSIELRRKQEQERWRIKEKLESLQNEVSNLEFLIPQPKKSIEALWKRERRSAPKALKPIEVDNNLWADVTGIITSLAAGEFEYDGINPDKAEEAKAEITRLEEYITKDIRRRRSFKAFYKTLQEANMDDFDKSLWDKLSSAIENKSADQINSALVRIKKRCSRTEDE